MKNSFTTCFALVVLMISALGCGLIGGSDNTATPGNQPTLTDKAVGVAVGDEKIGVTECDEVVDLLNGEINNPDDNFVIKAAKATALNKFKEQFRLSIEQNKTDPAALAKTCREFKVNLEKYRSAPANTQ